MRHSLTTALLTAIALSVPTLPGVTRPLPPDYPCYLIDHARRVINLGALCAIGRGETSSTPAIAPELAPSEEKPKQNTPSGKVTLVGGNVVKGTSKDEWVFVGQLKNETTESIRSVRVVVEATVYGRLVDTKPAAVQQLVLSRGSVGTFKVFVDSKDQPSFNVSSVEWIWHESDGIGRNN